MAISGTIPGDIVRDTLKTWSSARPLIFRIYPYMDGNDRMCSFLMDVTLASDGYTE